MNASVLSKAVSLAYTLYPSVVWHRSTHFAFLVYKNRIQYIGWNKSHTHPETLRHPYRPSATIHAELDCLLKPKSDDLSSYDMIVVRIDRNMQLNNSKPCRGCQSVINQLGVNQVVYTGSDGTWWETN